MTRVGKVPQPAAKVSGPGGGKGLKAQGVRSGAGTIGNTGTIVPANRGQGTKAYSGNTTKAQVTSLNKGGSKAKTGGGKGPSGRS